MKRNLCIVLLIASFSQFMFGQSGTYTVSKAFFSSEKFDEFSPVYYKNGIIFCSNRSLGMSNYTTSQNKGLFKIFFIDSTGNRDWENSRYFSKNLNTVLNDGPVTFNKNQDTIYFSRNQDVTSKLSEISSPRNKLGIYSAVLQDGQWTKIRDLRINNEWYNVTTPFLSPDGKKLYFASDKPGGYGGTDLYYSNMTDNRWDDPVNLGPMINTKGNESYPFLGSDGELFFASDGHPGMGGKDIFFSLLEDTVWKTPVRLDPPVNSESDDFGIVTDKLMKRGYFSTNRDKSADIYYFKTNSPQVFYDIIQKENRYCFNLSDNGSIVIDTLNLKYIWDFGDGKKATGKSVDHCFPRQGKYLVKLDIFDKKTNRLFFSKLAYDLEIADYEQPFINSPDVVAKGESISFDGLKSNLPGFSILSYHWNFRDGSKSTGETVSHTFTRSGEFLVNMELVIKSTKTGETRKTGISKKIRVVDDPKEKTLFSAGQPVTKITDIAENENATIDTQFSAETEYNEDVVYNVELTSSISKIGIDNALFKNVPKKYTVTEKFIPEESIYSYIVDQQMNLMATYPAFTELYSLGYRNVRIRTFVLTEPSEKELYNLIKINGAFADTYFDEAGRLTANAFIMLDQIVKLMNKYPTVRLEVAVHSDNRGSAPTILALSQSRAQLLVSYLVNRGISSKRLRATGFGDTKPIASNYLEADRKLNRRIDFIIINQ